DGDENRRFDCSQLFVRKSSPLIVENLVPNLGPVIRIDSHFLVVFSLKLDAPGVRGRREIGAQDLRFDGTLRSGKSCCVGQMGRAGADLNVTKRNRAARGGKGT